MQQIEREQIGNQAKGFEAIRAVFQKAARVFFMLPAVRAVIDRTEKQFTFRKYPIISKQADKILRQTAFEISVIMRTGTVNSWKLGEALHKAEILPKISTELGSKLYERAVFSHRAEAMQDFVNRVNNGLKLSERVWNLTEPLKPLLEKTVQIGIIEGRSAMQMINDLKIFLLNPAVLQNKYRRYTDELPFTNDKAVFHPGRGVYRSPEKNCRRMYANETNIAYRKAYSLQAQGNPVVVGFDIQLSNNHTLNGVPFVDVCDHLKGRYPKWFVFTGWHVLCRCHALSVLSTKQELNDMAETDLGGDLSDFHSQNEVKTLPPGFSKWIQDNAERSQNWKSQPDFIQNNFKGGKIQGGLL